MNIFKFRKLIIPFCGILLISIFMTLLVFSKADGNDTSASYINKKQYDKAITKLNEDIKFYEYVRLKYVKTPKTYYEYTYNLAKAYELMGDAYRGKGNTSDSKTYYTKAEKLYQYLINNNAYNNSKLFTSTTLSKLNSNVKYKISHLKGDKKAVKSKITKTNTNTKKKTPTNSKASEIVSIEDIEKDILKSKKSNSKPITVKSVKIDDPRITEANESLFAKYKKKSDTKYTAKKDISNENLNKKDDPKIAQKGEKILDFSTMSAFKKDGDKTDDKKTTKKNKTDVNDDNDNSEQANENPYINQKASDDVSSEFANQEITKSPDTTKTEAMEKPKTNIKAVRMEFKRSGKKGIDNIYLEDLRGADIEKFYHDYLKLFYFDETGKILEGPQGLESQYGGVHFKGFLKWKIVKMIEVVKQGNEIVQRKINKPIMIEEFMNMFPADLRNERPLEIEGTYMFKAEEVVNHLSVNKVIIIEPSPAPQKPVKVIDLPSVPHLDMILETEDGSKLSGWISRYDGKQYTVETLVGPLEIEKDKVVELIFKFRPSQRVRIILKDEVELTGRVTEVLASRLTVDTDKALVEVSYTNIIYAERLQ